MYLSSISYQSEEVNMVYKNLKRICKEKGITFQEIEGKAQLGTGCLSRWKDNKVSPNIETLQRVAKVINVPLTELVSEETKMNRLEENKENLCKGILYPLLNTTAGSDIENIEYHSGSGKEMVIISWKGGLIDRIAVTCMTGIEMLNAIVEHVNSVEEA